MIGSPAMKKTFWPRRARWLATPPLPLALPPCAPACAPGFQPLRPAIRRGCAANWSRSIGNQEFDRQGRAGAPVGGPLPRPHPRSSTLLPASIAASPAMRAWKSFKLQRRFRERTVHRLVEEINDMDAATNLSELANLRSTGLHKLK